jgi:hypothetical protein
MGTRSGRWARSRADGYWQDRDVDLVRKCDVPFRALYFYSLSDESMYELTPWPFLTPHSWENYMPAARMALYQQGVEYGAIV